MRDFFEKYKSAIVNYAAIFGIVALALCVGSMFDLSENAVQALLVLGFMAGLAAYLHFKKNTSENEKTLSACLLLALLASPFVFLFYYLIF